MTEEIKNGTNEEVKSRTQGVNDLFDSVKNKFDEVVIVGLKNGIVDVATSIPTYQFAQWMLDRAKFELLVAEKAQIATEVEMAQNAENSVKEKVKKALAKEV